MQTNQANCNNNSPTSVGVVRWVVPPSGNSRRGINRKSQTKNGSQGRSNHTLGNAHHYSDSFETSDYSKAKENCNYNYDQHRKHSVTFSIASENNIQLQQPVVDKQTCKTICTFVEEHLKELQEHQLLINRARSFLINSSNYQGAAHMSANANPTDITYIARCDTYKLKVRDEQTRAIETIKQLTNYLRELSYLESQYNKLHQNSNTHNNTNTDIRQAFKLESSAEDEEIITKLSDLRSDIIQALNNFVLSNSDIDVPIIDADDINKYDYDLCIDVQAPSPIKKRFADLSNSQQLSSNELAGGSCGSTVNKQSPRQRYFPSNNKIAVSNYSSPISDNSIQQQQLLTASLIKSSSSSNLVSYSQDYLERRSREIRKLERDTAELRRLFSDFYDLVKNQGEQINTIEDNIVIATNRISEGQHNLNKSMRGLTIIMPVTGCITGALIGGPLGLILGGKLGGITIGCATSLLGLLSSYSAQRCLIPNKLKDD